MMKGFYVDILEADCPRLENIKNGWVDSDHSTSKGAIIRYHCEGGFFLAGRMERKCLSNGKWEGTPPSCEDGNKFKHLSIH